MDKDVKDLFKLELRIIRMLVKRTDDHEKWLRNHHVRLNEHWKHISK